MVHAWPLLLGIALCWPLLTQRGHPLARDLVFVPRQPLTDASIGLGSGAPRAVPLDAVVALLDQIVDGGVLSRIGLPLLLAVAGWGVIRLVPDLGFTGRLVAGGFAVWNPFTVERMVLGQWALLAGYAALPWLVASAARYRREGRVGDLGATAAWLGLASLTPTGGLLGVAAVLAGGIGRTRRAGELLALGVLLQLPWVLPSVLGSAAARSDPRGVGAFSAGDDGPGGVITAVLGLGGIWDARSVPPTRETWWATLTAVVVVASVVLAWRVLPSALVVGRTRLVALAGGGLLLALLPSIGIGESLVRALVESVPGAGLLRDSQKFVAPLAVLAAVAAAVIAHTAVRAASRYGVEAALSVALLAVPLPVVLLPDGATTVWRTVDPVTYPSGLEAVDALLDDAGAGDVATLPWRSYRGFAWGNGETSSDPAVRWFDRTVLVSDDLQVGSQLVRGEDLRARALGASLAQRPVVDALAENGVAWALVYRDDPAYSDLDLLGLDEVYADDDLALYRVPGVPDVAGGDPPGAATHAVVVCVDLLALVTVMVGFIFAMRRVRKRVPGMSR